MNHSISVGPEEFFHKAKSESRTKGDVKRPLSEKQIQSACAVFGDSISPACGKRINASSLAGALKQELQPVVEESQETIAAVLDQLNEALLSLDERVARLESDEINEEDKRWRGKTNGQHVSPKQFFRGSQ